MDFKLYGDSGAPTLLLIPGLGVSYEIFLPLIKLLEEKFRVIAVQLDGFTMGVNPFGGRQAVLDGYKDVYTNKLESITGADIQFWYGSKEAFVAKPQVRHLLSICPDARITVFPGMNHGQLLIDRPEEVAGRILEARS